MVLRTFDFIKEVYAFLQYWYFRYTLVTELYMVEVWERHFINMFLVTLFFCVFLFNYRVLLSAIEFVV